MIIIPAWDFRQLYEQPPADLLEAEAFFSAFARFHEVEGHRVECILAKARDQAVKVYPSESMDGVTASSSVLFLRDDVSGIEQGAAIKVDGTVYKILKVSRPVLGLTRIELEGYSG